MLVYNLFQIPELLGCFSFKKHLCAYMYNSFKIDLFTKYIKYDIIVE